MLLGMAATITVPMVGWMRYRGHGWRANTEMSASMLFPTFAAIALLEAGVVDDVGVVLVVEHIAMLLGMLGVMLLRPHRVHAPPRARPRRAGDGGVSLSCARTSRPPDPTSNTP
jgi:hypothetical protein